MNLQKTTKMVLTKVGVPVSVFCRKINISDTAYYRWLHDDLRLSTETENRIRRYINKLAQIV